MSGAALASFGSSPRTRGLNHGRSASGGSSANGGAVQLAEVSQESPLKRLQRDYALFCRSANPHITLRPSSACISEWHFVLHNLPADTPFHGGCFHGKMVFPTEYPLSPPIFSVFTPNGRFRTNAPLYLRMTEVHSEGWNPTCSVETVLTKFLSLFVGDCDSGLDCLVASPDERRQFAEQSWAANACNADFRELFPEFATRPPLPMEGTSNSAIEGRCPSKGASVPAPSGDARADQQRHLLQGAAAAAGVEPPRSPGSSQPQQEQPLQKELSPEAVASAPLSSASLETPAVSAVRALETLTVTAIDEGSEELDCIICREGDAHEPLIYPCACRMSGVHASCVERWVAYHRRTSLDLEPPRCSVCRQVYAGHDRRPGVRTFLRKTACQLVLVVLRCLVYIAVLRLFHGAANSLVVIARAGGGDTWALVTNVAIVVCFSLVAAQRTLVLMISLPRPRPQPRHWLIRRFFVTSDDVIFLYVFEVCQAVQVFSISAVDGSLPYCFAVPYITLGLMPLFKRSLDVRWLRRLLSVIAMMLFMVPMMIAMVAQQLWRNPRRVLHPLGPAMHMVVPVAYVAMCVACHSNVPVVILLGSHSALMMLGILEAIFIRRLRWFQGWVWVLCLFLSLQADCGVEIYRLVKDVGFSRIFVDRLSTWWFCVSAGFILCVNRDIVTAGFREWQHRHGSFTLQVPPAAAPLAAPEPESQGPPV